MKYTSTRDPSISVTFEEALCTGYAPGGGLFVPKDFPTRISERTLEEWKDLNFYQLAKQVMRKFISSNEISDDELEGICLQSFVKGFNGGDQNTVPIRRIGSAFVAELFHGPTFCFKDLGMRAVINMLSHFATKRSKNLSLIVSTTGDTGPAAVQAVSDIANPLLKLLVHYPKGQISAFQRRQLTTVNSPFVRVASFEGGGDDMDLPIKNILASSKGVCGVNSYNIGRPLVQMVHFIWTYLRVVEDVDESPESLNRLVDIILPTGAMGNIAGGFMAKKLLPLRTIGKLVAGVNINDISHRAISKGEFHRSDKMETTLSEAINIQVPYNFERLLYYITNENHDIVKDWMHIMDTTQRLNFTTEWLAKLQQNFSSARITDSEMCSTMQMIHKRFNYFIDPHTAIAFAAAGKIGYSLGGENDERPTYAILSTASPCKFEESVTSALGEANWLDYCNSHFPLIAREILLKDECTPTVYRRAEDCTLEEAQKDWEETAKNILKEFLSI